MEKETKNNHLRSEIFSWVKELGIIILIVWFILTFVAQNTKVSGHSMDPTLNDGDFLVINKFIYNFVKPAQGDIIVFPHNGDKKEIFIKRIIGLPGDSIELKKGKVYINGAELKEDYLDSVNQTLGNIQYPFTVPESEYFVMGDNRNNSFDSRYVEVGTVPIKDIIGKASIRLWPFNQFGFLK